VVVGVGLRGRRKLHLNLNRTCGLCRSTHYLYPASRLMEKVLKMPHASYLCRECLQSSRVSVLKRPRSKNGEKKERTKKSGGLSWLEREESREERRLKSMARRQQRELMGEVRRRWRWRYRTDAEVYWFNASVNANLTCAICQRRMSGRNVRSNMLQHLRTTHLRSQFYNCTFCGRRFTRKNNLEQHIRIHMEDRPYGCYLCGVNFYQSQHYFRHLKRPTHRAYLASGSGGLMRNKLRKSKRYGRDNVTMALTQMLKDEAEDYMKKVEVQPQGSRVIAQMNHVSYVNDNPPSVWQPSIRGRPSRAPELSSSQTPSSWRDDQEVTHVSQPEAF